MRSRAPQCEWNIFLAQARELNKDRRNSWSRRPRLQYRRFYNHLGPRGGWPLLVCNSPLNVSVIERCLHQTDPDECDQDENQTQFLDFLCHTPSLPQSCLFLEISLLAPQRPSKILSYRIECTWS